MGIMATTGDVASATTSTIGALTAAAAGAVEEAVKGFGRGLGTGAGFTPLAVLGLVGIGATGIIDRPILLAGGAAALLLRQFRHPAPDLTAVPVPVPVTVPATSPRAGAGSDHGASTTPVPGRAPRRRRAAATADPTTGAAVPTQRKR